MSHSLLLQGRTYSISTAKKVANQLRESFPDFLFDVETSGQYGRVHVFDNGSHIFLGVY